MSELIERGLEASKRERSRPHLVEREDDNGPPEALGIEEALGRAADRRREVSQLLKAGLP